MPKTNRPYNYICCKPYKEGTTGVFCYVGDQLESHPTHSQRGRSRGRGRGFSQRGRGQQHRGNRGHHQGTSRGARGGRSNMTKPAQQQFLDFPFIDRHETVRLLPQFRVMFILRGLPGSGKSTVADAILQQYRNCAVVCSADYYRYNEDGEYVWHEDTLKETHRKCQRRAEKFASLNKPVIIIGESNYQLTYINKVCIYLHTHQTDHMSCFRKLCNIHCNDLLPD